jgi:4-hydroxybenzoate polyprenyltransferase
MNFLRRFFTYQNERFPFVVLIFTTYAVVSSSFTIVNGDFRWGKLAFIGFATGLLYTFHMRLFDEFKDLEHDKRYYPGRPVSRGLLTLEELRTLTLIVVAAEFLINLFAPLKALLFFGVAFLYSLLTRKEFFVRDWIREHFFVYNFTHYLQTALIIVYLYVLAGSHLSLSNKTLWIHFIFTNLTLTLLEWARKMRIRSEENESRDTYSARLGIRGSSIVFSLIFVSIFVLFYWLKMATGSAVLYASGALVLIVLSTLFYSIKTTKISSNLLQLSSLIYFVLLHILV